jgi:hypothetical protein
MHGMPRVQQSRYSLALAWRAWTLRAALIDTQPPETETAMRSINWQRLPCYLGIHHFVQQRNPDGEPYTECSRCSKYAVTQVIPEGAG